MRTLLDERFAPITSSIGFLELPLEEAAVGLERWNRSLYPSVHVERPTEGFPEMLHRLEPLTAGAGPRELLVSAGKWTAYFDNSLHGTDAEPAIGYLAEKLACQGVLVESTPHVAGDGTAGKTRYGSVRFQLFGPLQTHFLNYVRSLAAVYDDDRWEFVATGTAQPFEEPEAYRRRRIRDRFTSEMLERYCNALGIEVFNPQAYGPQAVFVESDVVLPENGYIMTLAEVQQWLGIVPGMADDLPG